MNQPKGSDRTTTKNLYIPRRYVGISEKILKSAKLLHARIDGDSYHAIIWLAAYIGMSEINKLSFKSLDELENTIGEIYNGNSNSGNEDL